MDAQSVGSEGLTQEDLDRAQESIVRLQDNIETVIQGKSAAVDLLLVAILANGSVLMEDVPGQGKTTLAKSLAISLDADYSRIQFTPDLLPADIVGGSIYNPKEGGFDFRAGPIFCNILLADEINRASPRTQSALLEAMAEMQVTSDGETRKLMSPFVVLATQNPVEFHGTYPLPEAQLDRFMMLINLGYPTPEDEVHILESQAEQHPLETLSAVMSKADLVALQAGVRKVVVDSSVTRYMVEIVKRTREESQLKLGVSTRGALMLYRACQAMAFKSGRGYVVPDDVQTVATTVLAHRLTLNTKAKYDGTTKDSVIVSVLESVTVPV